MEALIPIMLFILGTHGDHPGEVDLSRPEVLFATVEECEAAGTTMAERMTEAAQDKSGATYTHRCVAMPSPEEADAMFAALRDSAKKARSQ